MSAPPIERTRPLVLVVGDDRLMRAMTRDALDSGDECEIVEAASGEEALASFARGRPSVVILDLNMPQPDGFDVCAEIRSRYGGDPTPILVLSADDAPDSVDRAYEAGATDFMRKPINDRLLVHRVHHLLGVSRTLADLRREFTIILSKISAHQDAGEAAKRILRVLPDTISLDGHEVSVSASVGIAVYPPDGEDVDALVEHANAAMYHAKEDSRNHYQFFCESMNAASMRKLTLETQLREALDRDQLRLLYQPRLDLRSGKTTGVEALLRWDHPELGRVAPKEFIPLSEETGLIVPIGEWVLRTACAQNKAWQDAGYRRVRVSVNVSTRQFAHHDLRATVAQILQATGLDPRDLELELTESLMLQDDEQAAVALHELRAMGVHIALDDFGTGYSSMSYVIRFPLDTLKVDRCIVREVDSDPAVAGVFTALISMAHSLNLRVVAEGVDAQEQVQFLREKGCDEMQGFLLSPALSPEEVVRFLERAPAGDSERDP